MEKLDFRLFKRWQIVGNYYLSPMEVMIKCGSRATLSDLAIILGGRVSSKYRTFEGQPTCDYCTEDCGMQGSLYAISADGGRASYVPNTRTLAVRPALYSPEIDPSKVKNSSFRRCLFFKVNVAEYGEYPQTVVDDHTGYQLERLFSTNSLSLTGKNYTFDSTDLEDYKTCFNAKSYPEYELDGKRYVRVFGRPCNSDSRLSNGEKVESKKPYWVQVEPIEWLINNSDPFLGTCWISKKCLIAGIQFDTKEKYYGDFSKTSLKHYLDAYFAWEMQPLERTIYRDNVKSDEQEKPVTILKGNRASKELLVGEGCNQR